MAVIAVAAIAFAVISRSTPGGAGSTGLPGTLLYVGRDGTGTRLFRWDLSTGEVSDGPRIPRPLELVDAYASEPGTVGLVTETATGQEASFLRFLGADDVPSPAVQGDLVAWAFGGREVSSLVSDADTSTCGILRTRSFVLPTLAEEAEGRSVWCGSLVAFGMSRSDRYVSVRRADGTRTVRLNDPRSVTLPGWVLVGVSPVGSLLVVPDVNLPELAGQPLSVSSRAFGAEAGPVAYGVENRRLTYELLLGWSRDGHGAFVLGRYGGMRGVWLAPVDAGALPGEPTLVARIDDLVSVHVTEADGGVPILAVDDRLYRAEDGRLAPLTLPPGAPAPDGPILWLPALGDSSG